MSVVAKGNERRSGVAIDNARWRRAALAALTVAWAGCAAPPGERSATVLAADSWSFRGTPNSWGTAGEKLGRTFSSSGRLRASATNLSTFWVKNS